MKKVALLKGFSKLFGKDSADSRNISASKAISLQQEYIAETCESGEIFKQPYIDIAAQLDDKREEIADAALFYLKKIAFNSPQYAEDIIRLIEESQKKVRADKAREERFAQAVSAIKNNIL